MIRRPPRSTPKPSSAASDVYKRQPLNDSTCENFISMPNKLPVRSAQTPEQPFPSKRPISHQKGLPQPDLCRGRRLKTADAGKKSNQWRREGDSNPRGAFTPTRFPGVRLKPLGHPSNETVRFCRNIAALLCICNHIAGRLQITQLQSKLNSDMILR